MSNICSFTHDAMATSCGIAISGVPADYAASAARAAFDELDRVAQELSRFVPHSDIAQINSQPPGRALRIGAATWDCLWLARDIWQVTGGAFDVTLGTGMDQIEFDKADHAIILRQPGIRVDLGGIGKGHAVDAMAVLLRDDWRIDRAMVHAGQSTVFAWSNSSPSVSSCLPATGSPEGAQGSASCEGPWVANLRDPSDESRSLAAVVLRDRAFSGSGVGRHGQHIVDPRRSGGVCRLAAWALAPTAAEADALSTAFMVMDAAEVQRLCRHRLDVAGILLSGSQGAELVVIGDVEHL